MKTTPIPEAYCAEMNCDWQGEVPAIARCPKCGSRQMRRLAPRALAEAWHNEELAGGRRVQDSYAEWSRVGGVA